MPIPAQVGAIGAAPRLVSLNPGQGAVFFLMWTAPGTSCQLADGVSFNTPVRVDLRDHPVPIPVLRHNAQGVRRASGRNNGLVTGGASASLVRNPAVLDENGAVEFDGFEKPTVVAHANQRSREAVQGGLQLLDRREVEVVGRFVQHETVDAAGHQNGQDQPGSLPG